MDDPLHDYNQKILISCGMLAVVAFIIFISLMGVAMQKSRQATQYPGSQLLNSHSNYTRLPRRFKWDETYLSTDEFPDVYRWYYKNFGLSTEMMAVERCVWLEATETQTAVSRFMSVFICDTPEGQMVFVSRTMWFGN